ncbi:MAG: hypothetical protein KC994_05450 [Candidatus Omnitrophica bacterium]|nr:hypothetical protein [Candidatus Omnitrophota bacterium]
MKNTINPVWILLGLFIPVVANAENPKCPFDEVGENVLVGVSLEGWNSLWESIRAPELGDQILEGIREDLLPAILKEAQIENESATMEAKVDELVENVDWNALADMPISLVIWSGELGIPMFTLRADAPDGQTEQVHEAFHNLLKVVSGWFEGSKVREEGNRIILSIVVDEEETDWIYLESSGDSTWITLHHTLEDALLGKGLKEREGFSDLWGRNLESVDSGLVIDFHAVAETIAHMIEGLEPEMHSSLVLDETMEELFKDDMETLKKLQQVENDMDFLTGGDGEDYHDPMMRLVKDLGGFGILVSTSGPTENGIETSTVWRVEEGADIAPLLESPPLSDRFLTLIQPELLRGSAYSLPDLRQVYQFILDRIKVFPGGEDLLAAWKDIQTSIDLDLGEDLFPALGNEFALLTRRSDQASFAGFRLVNNESYLILETNQDEKVQNLLTRLDEILETYQLNPTRANIEGVTFTQLVAGLMGEAAWGWSADLDVLVATTNPRSKSLPEVIRQIKEPTGFSFDSHPRWDDLQRIWSDNPTAVVYDDLSTTWRQQVDELKGAKMMLSMMGGGDPVTLGIISLAMEIFTGIPAPDAYLRVDTENSVEKLSRSLMLFPIPESDDEP